MTDLMKTIILNKPGEFAMINRPQPAAPGPGEALVRIARIGVCGTDIHAYCGNQPFFSYPRVLGHELGVEVVAVGAGVTRVRVGDRCAVEPYLSCGICVACRRGKTNCCVRLQVLGVHCDGGFCQFLLLPQNKLHPSRQLSLEQLALVETLGIGAHAVDRAAPVNNEWALVIGLGPIGLATLQFVIAAGARPIVMESNPRRVEFCQKQLGIQSIVNPAQAPLEQLASITQGELPTTVFDATGNARSMMAAFQYVASGGKLVLVGLFQGDVTFHDPEFHRREMTLLSSRNSREQDFQRIIALVESGQVDTRPWITHRGALSDVPDLFPTWVKPETGVLKAMIEIE